MSLHAHLMNRGGNHLLKQVHGVMDEAGVEYSEAIIKRIGLEDLAVPYVVVESPSTGMTATTTNIANLETAAIGIFRADLPGVSLPLETEETTVSIDSGKTWYSLAERPSTYSETLCTLYLSREPLVSHGNFLHEAE